LFEVQGVFTILKELIDQIIFDQTFKKYKADEQLSISIFNTKHFHTHCEPDSSDHFIYSQLLINCLIQLPMTSTEKIELYTLCKEECKLNKKELQMIYEFERNYSMEQAIWWFTRNSFLYKMLIKALRIQNLELLFLFRYVIQDIQIQIELNQSSSFIDVYRSQLMTKNELQKLKDSLQQFISVNSFLSAIPNRETAIKILNNSSVSDDIERVLFEIHADGKLDGVKPFTHIKSKITIEQDEILFSIGSFFQLNDICLGEGNIWTVKMTLCANNDTEFQTLFKHIEEQYGNMKSYIDSFGLVLQEMRKYDEAQKFYSRLIKISQSNPQFIQECQEKLNKIFIDKENYRQQLLLLDESIGISIKKGKINGYNLASDYMHKGEEYRKQGNLKEALRLSEKALSILKESYYEDHQYIGRCYSKIGLIYQDNNNYEEALKYYEQAKIILEDHLPSDHPDLSEIYGNIGDMYQYLRRYDEALLNYKKSREIAERSSISQLPSIISILNKIASTYEKKNDYSQALAYYEELASLLPPTHVDVDKNRLNINRIRKQLS
jgi:tetratricopeptide (TPR) repeat protein